MMALPVKKKPTIAGRAWTSLVRNRLSVGVCNAPAIPVRKATIKNAVDVKSKGFGEAAAGCDVQSLLTERGGVYAACH